LSTIPLLFDAPYPGNPHGYPHNLTLPESRITGLHFLLLTVWVYISIKFSWGLRKMHAFCNKVCNGYSRSSEVVDSGTNQKGTCNFLLVINCNLGHILHCFWDMATYWLKIVIFPIPLSFNALTWGEPVRISGWTFYCQGDLCRWRFRDASLCHFNIVPACNRMRDGNLCWRSVMKAESLKIKKNQLRASRLRSRPRVSRCLEPKTQVL